MKWVLLQSNVRPASPAVTVVASTGAADLSWSAVSGATGYVVHYYVAPNSFNPSAGPYTVAVNATSYRHSGLVSGAICTYFVVAVFPWGETLAPPYPSGWQRVTIP